jgi:Zn-finger nucleic acid-binding protein
MRAMHIGATSMFECSDCSSTWLDAESFAQLLSNREERGRLAATVTADRGSVVRTVGDKVRYRNCPRCKKLMNRENFGRRSGVVIDVCRGHGVWFERGELASVAAFVDAGGLERARVQEDERRRREREQLEKEFKESGRRMAHVPPTPSNTPADSLLMEALRKLLS